MVLNVAGILFAMSLASFAAFFESSSNVWIMYSLFVIVLVFGQYPLFWRVVDKQ
jgi:hypothetical protein